VGRDGPTQLTGSDSAQKVWADLGPTKSSIFHLGQTWPWQQGWARTSLAQRRKNQQCWARISLARQHNIRGELFSPSLLACRTLFILHAREKQRKCKQLGGRKVTWRGGGGALLVWLLHWRCCGGGRWRCCGSRAAAPNSNVTASDGGKKGFRSSLLFHSPPLLLLRFLSLFVRI